MQNRIKITFTGGDMIGDTVERSFEETLLVGRSHSADIRVREADVSGRHLEFVCRDGACIAHNLSRYPAKVDGRQLATGEEAEVKRHSVVELGVRLRFRIDELGGDSSADRSADLTSATFAVDASMTQATRFQDQAESRTVATEFMSEETFATRVMPEAETSHVAVASLGESATKDIDTMFDDSATEDDPPESPPAAFDVGAATSPAASGGDGTASIGKATAFDESDVTNSGTGGGETQEMMTRVGSMDELLERRRQLERAAAGRHWRFGIVIALLFLALAGVWFATADHKHVEDALGPFLANGEPDVASTEIVGQSGTPDLFVEYPRDDRMTVVTSASTNEVEVNSFLGRDRDIPFRSWFCRQRSKDELKLSLVESFDRWMGRMTKEKGFSFERTRNGKPIEIEFFDDVFAGFCEITTQNGATFVRTESTHAVGQVVWRGVCYMLRSGDTTYTICNEIPEMYWKRGEMRLWHEPFFGLYADFIRGKWDSPGADELMQGIGDDELVAKISHALSVEAPGDFVNVEKWLDTLLVSTWGTASVNARAALELRQKFLDAKKKFYNERLLAYRTARENEAVKEMRSIFWDCQKVFGELKRDRRRSLVNNPEVWECQQEL